MKQKTKNMATQNIWHAAAGMRHAEIIPTSALRGRLFLTLLIMLLTTATAGAQSAIGSIQYNSTLGAYEINSTDNLHDLAVYVNGTGTYSTGVKVTIAHDCNGLLFKQTANITYTHNTDWDNASSTENNYTPIGGYFNSGDRIFKGTYDGQGHTISGIRRYKSGHSSSDENQGLFGMTGGGAVIRGITLTDARITGYNCTGGIVGFIYTGGTTVSDCHVAANVTIRAHYTNAEGFGGIVGGNYSGSVSYCTSAATFIKDIEGPYFFGGIVGSHNCGTLGTLSHNLAIGAVVPAGKDNNHGAICSYYDNPGTLENNYYYGCKVASDDVSSSDVGCENADVTENDGAVPGIILYDNSSRTDINSYILTTVGNAAVPSIDLANRTLYKDGAWNTLVLPFSLASLTGTPLEGATLMELDTEDKWRMDNGEWIIDNVNGTTQTGFDNSDGTLYLFFKETTSITAGKPYIIKWAKPDGYDEASWNFDLDSPVFTGVTVSNANNDVAFTGGSFKGTYNPMSWDEETPSILFVGDDNSLHWPLAGASLGACRAYFQLAGGVSAREFVLNFGGENTTAINEHESHESHELSGAWYSLDGRKLNGKPTKKGLYIVNGKKIVIK